MSSLLIDALGLTEGESLPLRLHGSKIELHFKAGNLIALANDLWTFYTLKMLIKLDEAYGVVNLL